MTKSNWQTALTEMRRILKPGGILEIFETDYRFENRGPDTRYITDRMLVMFASILCLSKGRPLIFLGPSPHQSHEEQPS